VAQVKVRRMRPEELEEVGKMYSDFYSYHRKLMGLAITYSHEWGIKELKSVGGVVLVAVEGDEIVGFARVKEEEGAYFLKEIYVKPERRRKGVGRLLLKACEELAGGQVYANVIPANLPALDFFIKSGYSFFNTIELTRGEGSYIPVLGRLLTAVTPAAFKLPLLKYELLEGVYCISKCDSPPSSFLALVNDDGLTAVTEGRPECAKEVECGYRVIRFPDLPLELVGLMAVVSNALASEGISILAFSSYSSDLILVEEKDLERALKSLERLPVLVSLDSKTVGQGGR